MRIDNTAPNGPRRADEISNSQDLAGLKRKNERGEAGDTDRADLSALSAQLTNADSARIERLKNAVQSGAYQVDAAKVASKIVADSLRGDHVE